MTLTVKTDGIHDRLPRLDTAVEAARELSDDDLALLQKLRDAATEILASPTIVDTVQWITAFEALAKTKPHLGL